MSENIKAIEMFGRLCRSLDNRGWHYRKEEGDLAVIFTVTGDDFPMDFLIRVLPQQELIHVISPLDVKFPEDKRIDGAVAVALASYGLTGQFTYDINDGSVMFKMNESFRESEISDALIDSLIEYSILATDKYNDMFLMLAKGLIDIATFAEKA